MLRSTSWPSEARCTMAPLMARKGSDGAVEGRSLRLLVAGGASEAGVEAAAVRTAARRAPLLWRERERR